MTRMTRSRTQATRDSPRPRRKAAVRASGAVAEVPAAAAGGWTDDTGNALVGAIVSVWWPDDERYYDAIVTAYIPRSRKHKIVYLEDETMELVELGDADNQRGFQRAPPPDDPLIGKDVTFVTDDDELTDPTWFDFMRGSREKKTDKFVVKVYAKLTEEPAPNEVCSPVPDRVPPNVENQFYRVIYVANDFLATVNFAHVDYRIVTDEQDNDDADTIDLVSPEHAQRSALPSESRRPTRQTVAARAAQDADEDEDGKHDDAYVPPADDFAESEDENENGDEEGEKDDARRKRITVADADEEPALDKKRVKVKTEKPGLAVKEVKLEKPEDDDVAKPPEVAVDSDVGDDAKDGEKDLDKEEDTKPDTDEAAGEVAADDADADQAEPETSSPKAAKQASLRPDVDEAGIEAEPELDPLPDLGNEIAPVVADDEFDQVKPDVTPDQSLDHVKLTHRTSVPEKAVEVDNVKSDGSKSVTADRAAIVVDKDPHSGMDVDTPTTVVKVVPDESLHLSALKETPEDSPAGHARAIGEGSAGTQDTRDEPLDAGEKSKSKLKSRAPPLPPSLYPRKYQDEEAPDTASDERNVGWVSPDKRQTTREAGSKSQVGDYISLAMGEGKEPRKAFVEAYLPGSDEHFVAFCDSEGGNMQLKLTKQNHTVLKDDEVDELNRRTITAADPSNNGSAVKTRGKRRRNAASLTLKEPKSKRKREAKPEVRGDSAGPEVNGRCLKIEWPGSDFVYTALVLGYNSQTEEHLVVYLSDHCIETVVLKYREWNLVAREDEPWMGSGLVGKRLYVFWDGEYTDEKSQEHAKKLFGEDTRVPYEAYVISYEGGSVYKVLYPSTEDTEVRELTDGTKGKGDEPTDKDWDIIDQAVEDVSGLPIVTWSE